MDSANPTFDGSKTTIDNEANEPIRGESDHCFAQSPSSPNFHPSSNSCKAESSSNSNITSTQNLREGQNVWVFVGKVEHAAIIEYLFYSQRLGTDEEMVPMARVKWPVQGNTDDVFVSNIRPMLPELDSEVVSSSVGKRRRRQTNFYQAQNMKPFNRKAKCKSDPNSFPDKRNRPLKSEVDLFSPAVLETSILCPSCTSAGKKPEGGNEVKGAELGIHSTKNSNLKNNDDKSEKKMNANTRKLADSTASHATFSPSLLAEGEENSEQLVYLKSDGSADKIQFATNLAITTKQLFFVGEHVWVQVGKEKHPASIKSIYNSLGSNSSMIKVKWASSKKCDDVELRNVTAMFEEDGGIGKRKRIQTNRFAPPPLPVKCELESDEKNCAEIDKSSASASISNPSPNPSLRNSKSESQGEENKKMQNNLNAGASNIQYSSNPMSNNTPSTAFSVGQHVWVQMGKESYLASIISIYDSQVSDSSLVRVKWGLSGKIDDVELKTVTAMPGEDGGSGKRKRIRTDRYIPPKQSSAQAVKREPAQAEKRDTSVVRRTALAAAKTRGSKVSAVPSIELPDNLFITLNTNSIPKSSLTVGQNVWVQIGKERHSASIKSVCESQASESNLSEAGGSTTETRDGIDRSCTSKSSRCSSTAPLQDSPTEECKQASSPKPDNYDSVDETIDDIRLEYESLYKYYLEPIIRCDEELPSGMTLRQRKALPSLIRCKNSMFRRKLYKRILHLEQSGKKREIYDILKKLYEYDIGGKSGDGPPALVKEIMPTEIDDDVVILESPPESCSKQEMRLEGEVKFIEINDSLTLCKIGQREDFQTGSAKPDVVISKNLEQKESDNSERVLYYV